MQISKGPNCRMSESESNESWNAALNKKGLTLGYCTHGMQYDAYSNNHRWGGTIGKFGPGYYRKDK